MVRKTADLPFWDPRLEAAAHMHHAQVGGTIEDARVFVCEVPLAALKLVAEAERQVDILRALPVAGPANENAPNPKRNPNLMRPAMAIDLNGMPYGIAHFLKHVLAHETTTPDHVLLMADCLQKLRDETPLAPFYIPVTTRVINDLRDIAPTYATKQEASA